MYSSLHISSQRHVTDSSQYLRPFASLGQLTICQAAIRTSLIARVLHAWFIVFLELSGHNDASTFHVISQALVRSPAQGQDSTKLFQFPNAQSLEH